MWSIGVLGSKTITPSLQGLTLVARLSCFGGFDVFDGHIEIQSLSRQRMIEVDDHGFFFDLVHADRHRSAIGALGHQR